MPVRFAPSAIRFLDAQPQNVRSKLINDVVWLRDNSDDPSLEEYLAAPVVINLYRNSFQWVLFYNEADSIIVANIGSINEEPHLWREG